MPKVTVTAAEGARVNVRKQMREEKASVITEQGYDGSGNPTIVQKFGPKVALWPDQEIVSFASEARDFDVDADNRIVVEAQ